MNILITSASRKVSLVRAFQKALAAEGGGLVLAVDSSSLAPALQFADRATLVPRGLEEHFTRALEAVCARQAVRLIVPTRDEELPFFAATRDHWASLGVTVMVASLETIRTCQDKRLFLSFLRENGFRAPRTYSVDEVRPEHYPLFIKERRGKGGRGTWLAERPDDLMYALGRAQDPIIQQCVYAPEYTIDLFADFDGRILAVVPRQRVSIVSGESYVGRTCKDRGVIEEAIRLATALGLRGHNTLQCFLTGEGIRWIEVNPRYGGGASLGIAAGADTPRMLLQLLKGQAVAPAIDTFQDGLVMLRYTDDLFLSAAELEGLRCVA